MPAVSLAALLALVPQDAPRFAEVHQMLPRALDDTREIVPGDVDGDLDLDLVAVVAGQDRLLLNAGDGRFEPGALPLEEVEALGAALGDVDGDGDLDLLRAVGEQSSLYLGDGSGGFAKAPFPPGDPVYGLEAALGDADGDGDLDAFVAGLPVFGVLGGGAQMFLGDGSGGFAHAAGWIPAHPDWVEALALSDLDGDGDLDLLLGNSSAGAVLQRLYLNQGDGHFVDASAGLPQPGPSATIDLALADLDADGDLDAFLANPLPDASGLWTNAGAATFADASAGLPQLPPITAAVFLDAEQDHDPDLVAGAVFTAGSSYGPLLLLGDGSGAFAEALALTPELSSSAVAIAAGDVDADGDDDFICGTAGGAEVGQDHLWLADGHGGFQDVNADVAADGNGPVLLADLDADGFTDALVNGNGDTATQLDLGGPGGVFTPVQGHLPDEAGASSAGALGDVDGDGDLDAFWGRDGQDRLWLNDGHASFTDAVAHVPPSAVLTSAVELADLDGDGDLDALRADLPSSFFSPTDGQNSVLLNQGAGFFSALEGAFPPIFGFSVALAAGDADGDGDLDALVRDALPFGPAVDHLYLNDGSGFFADVPGALPFTGGAGGLAWADFDGDAVLEVFLGGGGVTGADKYLESDGAGHFADASGGLPAGASGTSAAQAADVDEDGALDLVLQRYDTAGLYLGDGTGAFADASAGLPELHELLSGVEVEDLDADGDLDAWLVGGVGPSVLLFNQQRGLAWRALPRIGKALVLDVSGPALEPWALLYATSLAPLELPPFGTLFLPPGSMAFLGFGLLDAEGRAALALAVPPYPALVGATFFAQGGVGDPLRLTNPEAATFSDL